MTGPNIVLLESQRLTDAANGGGQMTSTVVPDNQANNLFSNISREDRTAGRLNLRKAILMALSADTKTYLGVHAIISTPPSDPNVSAILFTTPRTQNWTDTRTDAVDFIESYIVQGPALQSWMYGRQSAGQRSFLMFQRPDRPLPSIGDVLFLQDTTVTPNNTQNVRITSISSVTQTFTDAQGDYNLAVVTVGISTPLQTAFNGASPQRLSTPLSPTLICTTTVADIAKYYGVTKPVTDIAAAAVNGSVESIFGQLIPATEAEAPLVLLSPSGANAPIATANATVTESATAIGGGQTTMTTTRAIMPGSLSVHLLGGSSPTYTDDSKGNLLNSALAHVGTVDYESGLITIPGGFSNVGNDMTYLPAIYVPQASYSRQQAITEGTQGYVYIDTLVPPPAPGTTTFSFRSGGKWYDLKDDGTGTLVGADGTGGGTVRFDSGALTVTCGAITDVGSNVVYSWGQKAQFTVRTGDLDIQVPAIVLQLSSPAKPGTVTITFTANSATRTVTDSSGTLTGYGTGTIDYGTGLITLRPTALPSVSAGISVAFQTNPGATSTFTPSKSGSDISFTLPSAPISPRSVSIAYGVPAPSGYPQFATGNPSIQRNITDDGAGGLVDSVFGAIAGSSVNYTTGVVSFNPDKTMNTSTPVYTTGTYKVWDHSTTSWIDQTYSYLSAWSYSSATASFVNGTTVTARSTPTSATPASRTDSFPAPSIGIDLTPTTAQRVVPGSVRFSFAGVIYVDRSATIYRTDTGSASGSINYTTGVASLTDWAGNGASTLTLQALIVESGLQPVGSLNARVPGQSIRPASFHVQANRSSDGALVTAVADSNGDFATAAMTGHIDVQTGFYSITFGQLVLDSSLTTGDKAQPWYNAANVDGTGHIWRPDEAVPGSIKYSAIVKSHLPLDPIILGVDPTPLPLDGRVQIIRAGDTLVFREPLPHTIANPAVASTTYTMPRGGLEDVVLYDQNGTAVDTSQYTTDPVAGSVTMASSLSLGAYTQPLVAVHSVTDMVLCTGTDINGALQWNRPLTNPYPAATSYVSAALVAGDLQAQYTNLFAQTTYNYNPNNLWDDVVQGSSPAAAYNDVSYPIAILDRDCITQRWMLIFTSSTGGNIASEHLGVVGTFTTSANVAPINGATGNPYFVLDYHGFGSGWASGNAIRFNTVGAGCPLWFARTTLAGAAVSLDDKFSTQLRWDE